MSSSSYKSSSGVIIFQSDASSTSRPSSVYSAGSSGTRSSSYTTYSSSSQGISMDPSRSSSSSGGSGLSGQYRSGTSGPGSSYLTDVKEIRPRKGNDIVLIQHHSSGASGAGREDVYRHQSSYNSRSGRSSSYYP